MPEGSLRRADERYLYGNPSGGWLVIEASQPWEPPDDLDGRTYLGTVAEALDTVRASYASDGRPGISGLARDLGVTDTALWACFKRGTSPRWGYSTWSTFVRIALHALGRGPAVPGTTGEGDPPLGRPPRRR